jgi:transcription initiation factor TFIID TATA-box-binding protein
MFDTKTYNYYRSTEDLPVHCQSHKNAKTGHSDTMPGAQGKSHGLKITNLVSVFSLGTKVDLKAVALHIKNSEYNPQRFSACVIRIKNPKATGLLFSSGRVICMGTKSSHQSKIAAHKLARIIHKFNKDVSVNDWRLTNVVGDCHMNFSLDLWKMSVNFTPHLTKFEPEVFPNLVYRLLDPKLTLCIYSSGKVVFLGAKSENDLEKGYDRIKPVLSNYMTKKFDMD